MPYSCLTLVPSPYSLERIQQYLVIDQEPKSTPEGIPPAHWPSSGELKVEKLSARYSDVCHRLVQSRRETDIRCRMDRSCYMTFLSMSSPENVLASVSIVPILYRMRITEFRNSGPNWQWEGNEIVPPGS